ncbi:LPXTG cell wall anchor domain-containing protein [Dactylosporangium sp. AC04546]|uniref:LPXTG cell wall anchor domain-containing protein n=1 Tax=Dactylosporangium sp. AC04546 TaxID=2862460 RepID=UPI001EDE3788|nr:LPXTG cell wall anchor domain-containing protein [Dactylosporangium sp. AC04546]WVK86682.1 LPXTG cell wall anchor domain-containing protein [Dactylosporangium sp. AC04546]
MKLGKAAAAAAAACVAMLVPGTAASAHVSEVAGAVVCDIGTGSLTVTWTLHNLYPQVATLSKVTLSPEVDGVRAPKTIAAKHGDKPGEVTFSYPLSAKNGSVSISYVGTWPDGYTKGFHGAAEGRSSCAAASAPPASSRPTLPVTGSSPAVYVVIGGTLLAVGGALLLFGRRRSETA